MSAQLIHSNNVCTYSSAPVFVRWIALAAAMTRRSRRLGRSGTMAGGNPNCDSPGRKAQYASSFLRLWFRRCFPDFDGVPLSVVDVGVKVEVNLNSALDVGVKYDAPSLVVDVDVDEGVKYDAPAIAAAFSVSWYSLISMVQQVPIPSYSQNE
jgi:hypothetical protein